MKLTQLSCLAVVLAYFALPVCNTTAEPVGTAFSYQGRLSDGGQPANGRYDLEFALYDALTNGSQIGMTVISPDVAVSNGMFAVTLDFGASALNGDARWLEVGVRTNGVADFAALAPRQSLLPVPYAVMAGGLSGNISATQLNGTLPNASLDGSYTNALNFSNPANNLVGDGQGITGLDAGNISGGTLADTQLSTNVAFLGGNQTFKGSNVFSGVVQLSNPTNVLAGDGAGLTGIDPKHIAVGLAGISIEGNAATATSAAVAGMAATAVNFSGLLSGDANGLQGATVVDKLRGVPISSASPLSNQLLKYDGSQWAPGAVALETDVTGKLPDNRLSSNVALLDGNLVFSGSNTFAGVNQFTNATNNFVGLFAGDGGGLSNLTVLAAQVLGPMSVEQLSGTLPSERLSGTYSNALTFNNPANSFAGSGASLTDVNAASLGGLTAGSFWQLGGNAGTTAGANFLGTVDNQPLELRVNDSRVLRMEPTTNGPPNLIGGAPVNFVAPGVSGATISGGGGGNGAAESNSVYADFGSIAGGAGNFMDSTAKFSAIGGGYMNFLSGTWNYYDGGVANSTISGGSSNSIFCASSAIAGGVENTIGSSWGIGYEGDGHSIGGGVHNSIGTEIRNSTISGGDDNTVCSSDSTIAGGSCNMIFWDTALAAGNTIGGGIENYIQTYDDATISGGSDNTITGWGMSAIGGGISNTVGGAYSVIPGGVNNEASGSYCFAAGRRAKANHFGAFVWADSSNYDFASTAADQFSARCVGGARFVSAIDTAGTPTSGVELVPGGGSWSSLSDRNAKENLASVNPGDVLEAVSRLPIATWNYKSQDPSIRHMGPMAQDFAAAFKVGENEKHITTVDADGVALAAIQGLNQKLEERLKEKDVRIQALEQDMAQLKAFVKRLGESAGATP